MKSVPKLNRPEYRIIFYHPITGEVLKYPFISKKSADNFFESLDPVQSKPTMYYIKRIR